MKGRYEDENLKWIPALIALVIVIPFMLKGMTFSYKYYLYILNTVGIYIILADDTVEGFTTDSDWNPKLFDYQQSGSNVLFFTFMIDLDILSIDTNKLS